MGETHWTGDVRDDGKVSIFTFKSDITGIVLCGVKAPDGHHVTLCPTCDRPIKSADAARRIADALFPPEKP